MVGEGVALGVTVGVTEGEGAGDAIGDGTGADAKTFTPLLQTNFPPDLMHVNLKPLTVEVAPALLHLSPCFTAPYALFEIAKDIATGTTNKRFKIRMLNGRGDQRS